MFKYTCSFTLYLLFDELLNKTGLDLHDFMYLPFAICIYSGTCCLEFVISCLAITLSSWAGRLHSKGVDLIACCVSTTRHNKLPWNFLFSNILSTQKFSQAWKMNPWVELCCDVLSGTYDPKLDSEAIPSKMELLKIWLLLKYP